MLLTMGRELVHFRLIKYNNRMGSEYEKTNKQK